MTTIDPRKAADSSIHPKSQCIEEIIGIQKVPDVIIISFSLNESQEAEATQKRVFQLWEIILRQQIR